MKNSAIPKQLHFKAKLIIALIMFFSIGGTLQAQLYPESQPETTAEAYSESALRRFEIIFLTSLPFTTIHSYLAIRGIRMIDKGTVAADLGDDDYKIVGASAVAFSLFIGFWDWLHTHDKSPSQPRIPAPGDKGERGKEKGESNLSVSAATFHAPFSPSKGGRRGVSPECFVPLLQVRF